MSEGAREAVTKDRGRLGRVAALLRERPCRIAFLGASVSAQRAGYAPQLTDRLSSETGQAHTVVQASLGGVGSISGAFLMDGLLADRRPDVCFVEFSTTDRAGYTPLGLVGPSVEGILRKLLALNIQPVILHLYRREAETFAAVADLWEQVAGHYDVPSLDLQSAWGADDLSDTASRMSDSVHLTGEGAALVARQIGEALLRGREIGPPVSTLPPRRHANAYDRTRIIEATVEMASEPSAAARRLFRFNYPFVEAGPGNVLRCEHSSGIAGLLLVVGPRTGTILVRDERGERRFPMFDEYCHYERLNTLILADESGEPRRTDVHLSLDEVDTRICRRPVASMPPEDRRLQLVGFLARA